MRRGHAPTLKLLERIGPASYIRRTINYWSPTQLAFGLGVTEQTVCKWERDGQIPPFELWEGRNWLSESGIKLLEQYGVKEVGGYRAITPERGKKLRSLGYRVPNSATLAKKVGAE